MHTCTFPPLDSFRGHISPGVKEAVQKADADLVVIPGGVKPQLQPLGVAVNKPFKGCIAWYYWEWLVKDDTATTPTRHHKKASLSEVATWVADAWDDLPEEII